MVNNLKALGILIIIAAASFFIAVPAFRFYDQYYSFDYGGAPAFLLGYLLCFYFISGLFYALFKIWYKTLLVVVFALSVGLFIWFVAGGDIRGWHFLILAVVGYVVGFIIRKVVERLRQANQ